MSRIGNKAITVPAGVELTIAEGNEVTVKGPKGSLTKTFSPLMEISVDENVITVKRPNEKSIQNSYMEQLEHFLQRWLKVFLQVSQNS